MAVSSKWIAGGTIDVGSDISAIPKSYKVGKVPNEDSQMNFGKYVQTHWTTPEEQPSLIDTTYAYCATDGNFCVNTGVLWNCGNGSPSFNRYKRYDLSSTVQNAIGFGRLTDKGTYANIGIYGGSSASSYKDDTSNTPLTNYLNGKNARNFGTSVYQYQSQVYGRNLAPIIEGFSLKDVVYVPIIMSYVLKTGDTIDPTINPATANKAQMQNLRYRLSSIDAFENHEYKENPYIMGVFMQPVFVKTDDTTKTVETGISNNCLPFCNGEYSLTTTVYNESGQQKEQEITYYPLYGDNQADGTTLDGWYAWYPEEPDPTQRSKWIKRSSMHPLCIMGYGANQSAWKLPLIRLDGTGNNASYGKLLLTGNWIKTDILQVSTSERYMKIYSDKITEANVHDFCEYVRRQAAYFGGFFRCDGRLDLLDYRYIDEGTYMGVIDGSGITHGDYTKGLDNTKNPAFDWTDAVNSTPYVPGGGSSGPTSGGDKDREKADYSGDFFSLGIVKDQLAGINRYIVPDGAIANFNLYMNQLLDYDASREQFITGAMATGLSRTDSAKIFDGRYPDSAAYIAAMLGKSGYGNDPRNSIVSLMLFPVEVKPSSTNTFKIKTGTLQIGEKQSITIPTGTSTTATINYAPRPSFVAEEYNKVQNIIDNYEIVSNYTIQHPKGWDDFRAYEPYSRAELYIPFHGTIPLNLSQCLGQKLGISIVYDTISGGSNAVVTFNDQLIYASVPGQIGFNVPFSIDAASISGQSVASLSAQSQANKLKTAGNLVNGLLGTGTSITSGNLLGAASSVANTIIGSKQNDIQEKAIEYNINHACDGRTVVNVASPLLGMGNHPNVQIIWHYPLMLAYNDDNYAHTVGYACARSGSVGSFKGYTVFTNADLSAVSATEQEKSIILSQLQNGIII